MKTTTIAARVPVELLGELRALQFTGEQIGATVRRLLAKTVGRPDLATVAPNGYPRGRKRPERAKAG